MNEAYLELHKKSINTHINLYQHIGFSTQNNTILCNQVRTKILSALKWETLTFKR